MGWSRAYKALLDENRSLWQEAKGEKASRAFAVQLAEQLEDFHKQRKIGDPLPNNLVDVSSLLSFNELHTD